MLCVATTAFAAPPSTQPTTEPARVVVPFKMTQSGHISIMAKVNGKGPFRFIFDTGAPALVIGEQCARDSGVLPKDFRRPFFTVLGNLGDFKIDTLEVGDGKQNGLTGNVWNHPTVELLAKTEGRLDGLIGFPFFAHYGLTIDYHALTLTLVPSTFDPTDAKENITKLMLGLDDPKPTRVTTPLGLAVSKPAGDSAAGVRVDSVWPDGPAASGGVRAGDRLLVVDGRWTDTPADATTAAAKLTGTDPVTITVFRDGKPLDLRVRLVPGI